MAGCPAESGDGVAKSEGPTLKKGNTEIQWDVWGLPIGNGRLGGVFYGSVDRELIQFNENSLWTGREGWESEREQGAAKPEKRNFGSYQPFGDIELSFPHATFTQYRRELDIARGVGSVTYASGGVTYTREYFASYPDQVLVVRLTASKPGSYTGTVRLTDRHFAKLTARDGIVTARGRLDENLYMLKGRRDIAIGTPEQVAHAQNHIAGNNLNYEAQMQVLVEGGSLIEGAEGELHVERADSVLILLAAGTDYLEDSTRGWRGPDPHAAITAQLQAAAKRPYAELLTRHLADYQSLFNRFRLDLGRSSPAKTAMPMDKRLKDYRSDAKDPELEALLAQYGRYLMISSSRPGSLPANLQGLWNPVSYKAPWDSDYHININLEMNYWLTEPANLAECASPLFDWMTAILPVCERETKARYGTRGWTVPWAMSPFGGGGFGNGKVEAGWLCQQLTEHYAFGGDKAWLKDVAFPLVHGAVLFCEDQLIEKNGLLVAPNTMSPEHGPREDGVSYAQEIVWELFTAYVEMADVLGTDKVHRDKIAVMRAKLATPKIGSWGQLMEWMEEHPKEENSQHRHVSQLYALYPGRQIAPVTTPDLAKAAEVILRKRGDEAAGWSKAWKSCFWARLQDGDHAMLLYRNLIKENIMPNLFDSINGGDKFQIDANFGATAAVCEMLLQSHVGELHLLPALPSAWPAGFVQGIRARNGFTVDIKWADGKLTRVVIHSTLGKPCKIRYGNRVVELMIDKGQSVELDGSLKTVGLR